MQMRKIRESKRGGNTVLRKKITRKMRRIKTEMAGKSKILKKGKRSEKERVEMNSNKKKDTESSKIFNIQTFLRDTESKRRRVSLSVGTT